MDTAAPAANDCDIKVFCCPKSGNSLEEYEDASAHRHTRTPVGIRVAVADGATESSFAKLWAVLLAESYVRSELAGAEFFAQLQPARRLWQRRLAGRPLPWFASEKAEQGAFAAFLGVQIDAHTNRWTALAVGDCCFMQVDDVGEGMRVVNTFPLQKSSEFTMSPYLIGSRSDGESLNERIQISTGSLRDGDMLLLATDAVAAWLLKQHEAGRPLWKWLYRKLGTPESFAAMVAYGRKHGLRNDDFTLVRIIHHASPVDAKER
ncbi:MAG TPA: protein phosphatase 2C domain-containing protein [Gemmatimonadales bacterium]|nr:protein phosphatase 2C domain-containing protein [Gemmatimonadales bacterium]